MSKVERKQNCADGVGAEDFEDDFVQGLILTNLFAECFNSEFSQNLFILNPNFANIQTNDRVFMNP